jgi:hypothetical protein
MGLARSGYAIAAGYARVRRTRAQSMIPKSVQRFSERIMLKQEARAG